jgi:hypothetical protein
MARSANRGRPASWPKAKRQQAAALQIITAGAGAKIRKNQMFFSELNGAMQ